VEDKRVDRSRVEHGYYVMKGTAYFVSLYTSVVLNEKYNVMVNSEELIGTTEHVALYERYLLNRCRYNRVRLYVTRNLSNTSQERKQHTNPHVSA
jgi:hypothetical protein